jgi:hypothetical protein
MGATAAGWLVSGLCRDRAGHDGTSGQFEDDAAFGFGGADAVIPDDLDNLVGQGWFLAASRVANLLP